MKTKSKVMFISQGDIIKGMKELEDYLNEGYSIISTSSLSDNSSPSKVYYYGKVIYVLEKKVC